MADTQLEELVLRALETEHGGVAIYRTALRCVRNKDLKEEWTKYLEQTEQHERIVRRLCEALGIDAARDTLGRLIVRSKGQVLVKAMELARGAGDPDAAQRVAAECVVDAETTDHMNWELIGEVAKRAKGDERKALTAAYEKVEDEEDEHLYHSTGWARELWLDALGLAAVLPPPEERKDVKTAIGAARAKQARTTMRRAGPQRSRSSRKRRA